MSGERALPRIVDVDLTPEAYVTMILYAQECRDKWGHTVEISGFARTIFLPEENRVVVSDPFILPQTCSFGGTEKSVENQTPYFDDFLTRPDVRPEEYACWWHSHMHGPVYFSTIDRRAIEEVLWPAEYFVSVVVNTRGHATGRLDVWRPKRKILQFSAVPQITEGDFRRIAQERIALVRRKIAEKVTIPSLPSRDDDDWGDDW